MSPLHTMPSTETDTRILRCEALAPHPELIGRLLPFLDRERLVRTATDLVAIPSPTGDAGAALDRLAEILADDGFAVERPVAGHPAAPAVVVRLDSGHSGKTLQFCGHLDVVHLPFVPPAIEGDRLTGSGSCDMKGGLAAAVEALRMIRDSGVLKAGAIVLAAYDLHEAPWGRGEQLNELIRSGLTADAVLIPGYLNECLPVAGRGMAAWKVTIRRPGPPIHEVMRPLDEPSVINTAAELIARLRQYSDHLAARSDPEAGSESVFIGQVHSGEIFNQFPQVCWLEGTRRWLPGEDVARVEDEFRGLVAQVAKRSKAAIDVDFCVVRDAFRLDTEHKFVQTFLEVYATIIPGRALPSGMKLFCDDGNTFCALTDVPAVTHGPTSGGAHTVEEWVSIEDMGRIALLYAMTAAAYCPSR